MNDSPPPERTAPNSIEAEQSVLGAILVKPEILAQLLDILTIDDFYRKAHQIIFDTMLRLHEQEKPPDLILVSSTMPKAKLGLVGGPQYLAALALGCTLFNVEKHARQLHNLGSIRRAGMTGQAIFNRAMDANDEAIDATDLIGEATAAVEDLAKADALGGEHTHASAAVFDVVEQIIARYESGKPVGIPSGYRHLDEITGGWKPGDVIVVTGATSMGKTSFTLSTVQNSVQYSPWYPEQHHWAIFSLEMSRAELMEKLVSQVAQVSGYRLERAHQLEAIDFKSIHLAQGYITEWPLDIFDATDNVFKPSGMVAKIKRMQAQGVPLKGVAVDLLQYIDADRPHDMRTVEVPRIMKAIKRAARITNLPWILICHSNRAPNARQDKRPTLGDLKESGAIEQDADVVIGLYREEYYNRESTNEGLVEVIVLKNRKGPIGMTYMRWAKEINTWVDLGPNFTPQVENGEGGKKGFNFNYGDRKKRDS